MLNSQTKANDLSYQIDELERNLTVKTWNVERELLYINYVISYVNNYFFNNFAHRFTSRTTGSLQRRRLCQEKVETPGTRVRCTSVKNERNRRRAKFKL